MEKYRSQYKQDQFVDFLFRKKRRGIFVDIGAHDGVSYSNTYFLEKNRDWNGLCIEPIPIVYDKLKQNRSCFLENCCISNEEKILTFRQVLGESEMLSGILEFFDKDHHDRIETEILANGGSYNDIQVESKNINKLLDQYNIQKIDYCSIDTEGAEYLIIQGMDFDKVHVTVFTIENNNNDNRIREYLKSKGYRYTSGEVDDFFVKEGTARYGLFSMYIKAYKFSWKIRRRFNQWFKR